MTNDPFVLITDIIESQEWDIIGWRLYEMDGADENGVPRGHIQDNIKEVWRLIIWRHVISYNLVVKINLIYTHVADIHHYDVLWRKFNQNKIMYTTSKQGRF